MVENENDSGGGLELCFADEVAWEEATKRGALRCSNRLPRRFPILVLSPSSSSSSDELEYGEPRGEELRSLLRKGIAYGSEAAEALSAERALNDTARFLDGDQPETETSSMPEAQLDRISTSESSPSSTPADAGVHTPAVEGQLEDVGEGRLRPRECKSDDLRSARPVCESDVDEVDGPLRRGPLVDRAASNSRILRTKPSPASETAARRSPKASACICSRAPGCWVGVCVVRGGSVATAVDMGFVGKKLKASDVDARCGVDGAEVEGEPRVSEWSRTGELDMGSSS